MSTNQKKFIAIVSCDNFGPAFGVGHTEAEARADALTWGMEPDTAGLKSVEITKAQYDRVKAGNPDAWNMAPAAE